MGCLKVFNGLHQVPVGLLGGVGHVAEGAPEGVDGLHLIVPGNVYGAHVVEEPAAFQEGLGEFGLKEGIPGGVNRDYALTNRVPPVSEVVVLDADGGPGGDEGGQGG